LLRLLHAACKQQLTTNFNRVVVFGNLQYKLHDCVIKVEGKINAIVIDSCSKTACVFNEALASVEVVNSKDIQIQCTTRAPAISIDGCTAITYYMPDTFADCQVITAKSAAVNLIRPTDDDDIVETPIPEQFCTSFDSASKTWVTVAVSHDD
jgi:adenylyl cyclase-associated protein